MQASLLIFFLMGGAVLAAATSAASQQQWQTERRTTGDTTIVRTVGASQNAGVRRLVSVMSFGRDDGPAEYIFGNITELERAPDGSIWLFDAQVPVLRRYDSTGRFIRSVGRRGQGPGEYNGVRGVAIAARGEVVLWTAGKLNVYGATGEFLKSLAVPLSGSSVAYSGNGGVAVDTAGNAYVLKLELAEAPSPTSSPATSMALMKYAPDGRMVDTLDVPSYGVIPPFVERRGTGAAGGPIQVRAPLPLYPLGSWALSPHGYFVASHGGKYAVDLLMPRGRVMRIERDIAPVPITPAERADAVSVLETRLRRADPGFRYSGQAIPTTRPPVNAVRVDEDGRIWVSVAQPGERIPDSRPTPPAPPPPPSAAGTRSSAARGPGGASGSLSTDWQETNGAHFRAAIAFDVFATDGRFLGRVPMPKGVTPDVIKGDFIWAITRDSLDVQRVTKFRIEPPLAR